MSDNKITISYKITEDSSYLDKQNAITPELAGKMERYHRMALEGKQASVQKFLNAIEKHPNNPQLKNYLTVLYNKLGDTQKVYETNRWIVAEHPDYLFGRLNLAFEYFQKKEYDKMPDILGQEMELKAMYPQRDTFHINEVTSFLKCAILYFSAIGQIEDAEIRYDILEELAPDSPDAEIAFKHLMLTRMNAGMKRMKEENEMRISVEVKEQAKTTKKTLPKFTHPEIDLLYSNGLYIGKEHMDKILSLPRESLIRDLEKVLNDSIERYSYFSEKIEEEGWNEETSNFVVHAFFLLGELQAEESLDCILNEFSQSEEYFVIYLGDFLTSAIWEPVYKIANKQLDDCLQFMYSPGIYTYSKSLFVDVVEQVFYNQPQRKNEIIEWYKQIINFFLSCNLGDNIIDSDLNGLVTWSVLNIGAEELLPEIKQMYDKDIVSLGMCGTYADVEKAFNERETDHQKEILSISERYKQITETWAGYNEEKDDYPLKDYYDEPQIPVVKEPKIGRNDPCPCESGKKYKKCCLGKFND